MSASKPNLVRLLSTVIGAAMSAWFVVTYTRFSKLRFEFEHRNGMLTGATSGMSAHGPWLFALPIIALIVGLWLLFARPAAVTTFELLLSATWLLALASALFCIIAWQAQNVPT